VSQQPWAAEGPNWPLKTVLPFFAPSPGSHDLCGATGDVCAKIANATQTIFRCHRMTVSGLSSEPEPGKDNPEEWIRSSELRPSMMSAKEDELLSQREIPERQLRPFLERRWDQRQ
jgi:hypothetical protein